MRIPGLFAAMAALLISAGLAAAETSAPVQTPPNSAAETQAPAQTPPSNAEGMPTWAPGPLKTGPDVPMPGRVPLRNLGLAFTLPETWRNDQVSWRELNPSELAEISALAEAAVVVEFAGKTAQRLLTLYRVPLKAWREADRQGKAGPGRIAIVTSDKGFVVVRPPEGSGDFEALRIDSDFAIGTLALYDAFHEERHLLTFAPDFAGLTGKGDPIKLHLDESGALSLSFGKPNKTLAGRWVRRDSQLIGHLMPKGEKIDPSLLLHYDGAGFVVIRWDEKVFGAVGGRLEKAP